MTHSKKVNWHLLSECNFKCCYCFREVFARQSLKENLVVLDKLEGYFPEINFVGGEITLLPYIEELIQTAYERGFKCSIVTNGYDFVDNPERWRKLYPYITTVGVSIDSLNEATNREIGRRKGNRTITRAEYELFCAEVKAAGLRLEVNTVVSRLNLAENIVDFYRSVPPDRIKLMQVFKPNREVLANYDHLLISSEEFADFVTRNSHSDYKLVIEGCEDISNSYFILCGDGAFIDSKSGVKGRSLIENDVDCSIALERICVKMKKYNARYEL